jgi:hypothetical protein
MGFTRIAGRSCLCVSLAMPMVLRSELVGHRYLLVLKDSAYQTDHKIGRVFLLFSELRSQWSANEDGSYGREKAQ